MGRIAECKSLAWALSWNTHMLKAKLQSLRTCRGQMPEDEDNMSRPRTKFLPRGQSGLEDLTSLAKSLEIPKTKTLCQHQDQDFIQVRDQDQYCIHCPQGASRLRPWSWGWHQCKKPIYNITVITIEMLHIKWCNLMMLIKTDSGMVVVTRWSQSTKSLYARASKYLDGWLWEGKPSRYVTRNPRQLILAIRPRVHSLSNLQ